MCHYCGALFTMSSNGLNHENGHHTVQNGGASARVCEVCGVKNDSQSVNRESSSPRAMASASSATSLISSDRSISNSSDISVEASLDGRGNAEDSSTDSSQEDSVSGLKRDLSNSSIKWNSFNQRRVETAGSGEVQVGEDNNMGMGMSDETDAEFWLPPDPEDQEDDIVGSVANNDDDDECGEDGISWSRSSSLSGFGEEGSGSYRFKEEKRKAMDEVMNGKFKALVAQLIKSVGVASNGNDGEHWVDIVTPLSWEAAAFVKPVASEDKAMDPDGYVKIKCVATGSRSESRLIKGSVFKKHAAHKHMPTKYKNPRLMLISDSLDLSSSGLSSFESMQQEKDILKSIIERIEIYHPNVILVEKSVSRSIQESILAKGMTLVFDMKLHRLKRVARCIGARIMSPDLANGHPLRQCDSFEIEKFVEEHNVLAEGGKKPSKTLMFIEGCPTRLGCTILLMGANGDELKRIKCVVRCAVVMAYHLMLETYFLLDQRAMFSTILLNKEINVEIDSSLSLDIPISNGFHEIGSHNLLYSPATFPGISLSDSLKIMDVSFPHSIGSSQSVDHKDNIQIVGSEEQNLLGNEELNLQQGRSVESLDTLDLGDNAEEQVYVKDEISSVLNSESILVLMSKRNASTGTVCEQSHFSHIKFYRNFDDPLGEFLQKNLLKQGLQCKACGKPPEGHFYYYAHHNKQLTIQVRRLADGKGLPGESEGKLWMWSRCGPCKYQSGNSKSTKRVLISTDARGLSFGKFLELNFSNHSSFNGSSRCGHSFHKDFLYFFGSGPMVAVFKYSPVGTYSVSLPHRMLDFKSSLRGEFLKKDFDNVYDIGTKMFLKIEEALKNYVGVTLKIQGTSKKYSDIVEMLKQEKSQFEVDIQNAVTNGSRDEMAYKLLSLNRVKLELLLESCVWVQRIHSMELQVQEQPRSKEDVTAVEEADVADIKVENCVETIAELDTKLVTSAEANDMTITEIPIDGRVEEFADGIGGNESSFEVHSDNPKMLYNLENDKVSMWIPYSVIWRQYMEDLNHHADEFVDHKYIIDEGLRPDYVVSNPQQGYLQKVESLSRAEMAQTLITDVGSRLHFPLGTDDYIVSGYDDEFSSIIACALAVLHNPLVKKAVDNAHKERGIDVKSNESSQGLPTSFFSFSSTDSNAISMSLSSSSFNLEESRSSSFNLSGLSDSGASHPQVSIPGKHKYSVVCLYAKQFSDLRGQCCPSELDYIASLSRCRNWDAKGGKSKSFFAKTLDDRFIIKEIKRTEYDSFVKFAPEYFNYMDDCYMKHNQTCLAKVLGIYQVIVRASKNGKETRHDLLVMENLSFGRNITKQYDLKGALHARYNSAGNGAGDVLLDQNFVDDMNHSPLYISRRSMRNLQRAVWNDTTFLKSINVMDYSLLVGVDTQRRELVCGIIDYLRQYTWDKQLENWVKSSLVVPKNQQPTVISPKEYKKRFRKFIGTHFLCVPDHWCSHRLSNPCKLCGNGEGNGSLHVKSQEHTKQDEKSRPSSPSQGRNGVSA